MSTDIVVTGLLEKHTGEVFTNPQAKGRASLAIGNGDDAQFALQGVGKYDLIVFCAKELRPPSQVFLYQIGRKERVHYVPLLDQFSLTDAEKFHLSLSVPMIAESYKRGERVLVTCNKGINRSAFVVALALRDIYGWSGEDCLRKVRLRRVRGTPLQNPYYAKVLEQKPAKLAQYKVVL